MNKTLHIALAAAAVVFAMTGCAKVNVPDAPEGQEITINATFAENQTKTTLQDGGTSVYWEAGDEIKLFYDGTGSRFTSQCTNPSKTSKFSGSLSVMFGFGEDSSDSTPIWGLYPYRSDATADNSSVTTTLPSDQTGKAGSFAKDMNLCLGKSTNLSMCFYNVCGGVKFSLTQSDVKEVIFKGLDSEIIAGKVKLTFEGNIPVVSEVVEGVDSVILKAPGDSTFTAGQWYYIVTLPATLNNGFEMTFNTEKQYSTLKSSRPVPIKRSTFGQLANIDDGLCFKNKEREFSGEDDDLPEGINMYTKDVSALTPLSATLNGTFSGLSSITGVAYNTKFCWSKNPNATKDDNVGYASNYSHPDTWTCDIYVEPNSTYYYRTILYYDGEYYYGEEKSFQTPDLPTSGYVDLGLSVYWGACNLGASSTEERGDYYAWGELSPKNSYDTNTYQYYDNTENVFISIGDDISGTKYDAVTYNLGDGWRIPTRKEASELYSNCKWKNVVYKGVSGYIVTGKNGNSIFIITVHYYGSLYQYIFVKNSKFSLLDQYFRIQLHGILYELLLFYMSFITVCTINSQGLWSWALPDGRDAVLPSFGRCISVRSHRGF